jgi:hypothetical protein
MQAALHNNLPYNAKLLAILAFKVSTDVDALGALSDAQPSYFYPYEFFLLVYINLKYL